MLKPKVDPTSTAKKYRIALLVMAFIHLALAIMYCFMDLMSGIYEFVVVAILFCSIASCNFCCLMMYMIYILVNLFTFISYIGLAIQMKALDTVMESGNAPVIMQVVVICLLCVYYIAALVVGFLAYREFKGMLFDATGGADMMGLPGVG